MTYSQDSKLRLPLLIENDLLIVTDIPARCGAELRWLQGCCKTSSYIRMVRAHIKSAVNSAFTLSLAASPSR